MKKLFVGIVFGALVMGTGAVFGQAQPFEGVLRDTASTETAKIWQRYYSPGSTKISAGWSANCPAAQQDPDQVSCQMTFRSKNAVWRGFSDDLGSYGLPFGSQFLTLIDQEENSGLGNHKGFYAVLSQNVDDTDTGSAIAVGCSGTTDTTCMVADNNSGNGTAVTGVPGGTINPKGGLRPMPVPRVLCFDNAPSGQCAANQFSLSWSAAGSTGEAAVSIGYDLMYAKGSPSGSTCPAATSFTFLKTVSGTSALVDLSETGTAPADNQCVTFALRLRYPTAGGTPMTSRYTSANGQAVFTGANGGLSSDVYDIHARWVRQNVNEVSFKTSLEDGVRGFYVLRGLTANGPFQRVSSLIPAKGEPSSYTYLDTIQNPGAGTKATGVWYKVESLDIDDQVKSFGPVKTEFPIDKNSVIKSRTNR